MFDREKTSGIIANSICPVCGGKLTDPKHDAAITRTCYNCLALYVFLPYSRIWITATHKEGTIEWLLGELHYWAEKL